MNDLDELSNCSTLIRRWAQRWGAPELADQIACEWSSRLRKSLGRAYPERMLVRLSVLLKDPKYASLFEHVLCHELAHVAAFYIHGDQVANHGPQWKQLVHAAGHEPQSCCKSDVLPELRKGESFRYEHICPVCQTKRTAKQPQMQWRCVACQNAGLEGTLIIQSHPYAQEALNE